MRGDRMSYAHSYPTLAAFLVRGLEAEVKVPCSRTMRYEPSARARLCFGAALWGPEGRNG
jgi:hypothetical protein